MELFKPDTCDYDTHDEKLVEMAMNGNSKAFSVLVERHNKYVTRLASRFLFREEDINDIVQDIFVRVWKRLPSFDGRCQFTTWLYTISFNLCIDRLRTMKRKREMQLSGDMVQRYNTWIDDNDTTQKADAVTIALAIRKFASGLSKVQRLVFMLRDLHDLPVVDVCRITGFKPDKVKANLFHARKFMREKLLKGGYI